MHPLLVFLPRGGNWKRCKCNNSKPQNSGGATKAEQVQAEPACVCIRLWCCSHLGSIPNRGGTIKQRWCHQGCSNPGWTSLHPPENTITKENHGNYQQVCPPSLAPRKFQKVNHSPPQKLRENPPIKGNRGNHTKCPTKFPESPPQSAPEITRKSGYHRKPGKLPNESPHHHHHTKFRENAPQPSPEITTKSVRQGKPGQLQKNPPPCPPTKFSENPPQATVEVSKNSGHQRKPGESPKSPPHCPSKISAPKHCRGRWVIFRGGCNKLACHSISVALSAQVDLSF